MPVGTSRSAPLPRRRSGATPERSPSVVEDRLARRNRLGLGLSNRLGSRLGHDGGDLGLTIDRPVVVDGELEQHLVAGPDRRGTNGLCLQQQRCVDLDAGLRRQLLLALRHLHVPLDLALRADLGSSGRRPHACGGQGAVHAVGRLLGAVGVDEAVGTELAAAGAAVPLHALEWVLLATAFHGGGALLDAAHLVAGTPLLYTSRPATPGP
jgi:hypothetical protein